MKHQAEKKIIIIAGPNGAGKTTFAEEFDKNKTRDPDFVKAEIAMQRAAQKAKEKARCVGAGVVVLKDGGIVE